MDLIQKRNKLTLWQEVVLQLGARHPPKLDSYLPAETGRQGCYLLWCLPFKEMVLGSLRKTFLIIKLTKNACLVFKRVYSCPLVSAGDWFQDLPQIQLTSDCVVLYEFIGEKKKIHIYVDPCSSNRGCSRVNCIYISMRGESTYI